ALVASPHDEAASGRRERYSGALARKGHGGRGPVEQDGRLFKSSDASLNATGHDEKNNGALILWRPVICDRQIRSCSKRDGTFARNLAGSINSRPHRSRIVWSD